MWTIKLFCSQPLEGSVDFVADMTTTDLFDTILVLMPSECRSNMN